MKSLLLSLRVWITVSIALGSLNLCLATTHNSFHDKHFSCEFSKAARLPGATVAHSATVLQNGDVLVLGGYGKLFARLPIATTLARIYDPGTHTWRVLDASLHTGRLGHAAVRMPDGKVLIVGGRGQDARAVKPVERFDPNTEQFRTIASLRYGRARPRLNLLNDYRVLVTGYYRRAEIIQLDPKSPTGFTSYLPKQPSRYNHSNHNALTLPDGSILLAAGGYGLFERFHPDSETFSTCSARFHTAIDDQAAAILYNGDILLAGGQDIGQNGSTSQCWLYTPQSDQLLPAPTLTVKMPNKPNDGSRSRANDDALLLDGVSDLQAIDLFARVPRLRGRWIFLCGGEYDPGKNGETDIVLDCAWVYDAQMNGFIDVGPMLYRHDEFALAPLPAQDGQAKVLIIGGHGADDSFQSHCEIFTFQLSGTPDAEPGT